MDETQRRAVLDRLGLDRSRPVAALCPGAEFGPAKRWPARYFAELAQGLAARGCAVWLIGSHNDRQAGADIAPVKAAPASAALPSSAAASPSTSAMPIASVSS